MVSQVASYMKSRPDSPDEAVSQSASRLRIAFSSRSRAEVLPSWSAIGTSIASRPSAFPVQYVSLAPLNRSGSASTAST
jgi:hypothetical protein